MRKFVVTVESPSKDEAAEFHSWIKSEKFGWWHWVEPMWLLVTKDEVGPSDIRDKAKVAFNKKAVMVIEVVGETSWAGYMPSAATAKKSPYDWIKLTWQNVRKSK